MSFSSSGIDFRGMTSLPISGAGGVESLENRIGLKTKTSIQFGKKALDKLRVQNERMDSLLNPAQKKIFFSKKYGTK